TGVVRGVGQPVGVLARLVNADRHELFPGRQLILIDRDLFRGGYASLLASKDRVLFAFLPARVIEVAALMVRHVDVSLFDVADHLVIKLLLESLGGLHDGVGVGILCLQILRDLRIRLVAQPGIVVDQIAAVNVVLGVDLLGDRRRRRRIWSGSVVGGLVV